MHNFRERIESLLKKVRADISYDIKTRNQNGYLAEVSSNRSHIDFYYDQIVEEFNDLRLSCTFEDFVEIVACHEIGHVVDPEYNEIYLRMSELEQEYTQDHNLAVLKKIQDQRVTLEKNAYNEGSKYVSSHLLKIYDEQNQANLQSLLMNFRITNDNLTKQRRDT